MKTVHIWDIKFNPVKKDEIVAEVQRLLASGRRGIHLTGVNPETVVWSSRSEQLRQAINDSDIVNIDNMLVAMILRRSGIDVPERAATPDVFLLLLQEADRCGQSVYFLGAKKETLEKMVGIVRQRYPHLGIAGFHDGYFSDESSIVEEIRSLAPDYLFIALPSPKKEMFIMTYKKRLGAGVCYGVGGAFDVLSGTVPRKSVKIGRFELEGLFRALSNPFNYGRRYLQFYPQFLYMVYRGRNNYRVSD